jgi:hypothetical protein
MNLPNKVKKIEVEIAKSEKYKARSLRLNGDPSYINYWEGYIQGLKYTKSILEEQIKKNRTKVKA